MLPFSSISEKFDDIARYFAVYLLIIFFFILDVVSLPSPFDVVMVIPFLNMVVYYWAAFRATLLPPVAVFVLGLVADSLVSTPLGMNAVLLVLVHWAISDQRAFISAQSFPMVWLVFILVNSAVMLSQWLVTGLIAFDWVSILALTPQIVAGASTFPILFVILHLAHKILPSPKLSLTSR